MGLATQSSKGLRVSTRCRDVEQFVREFHRFCEDSSVFISHARRSVGEVVAFSFQLVDASVALSGLGAVVEQFSTADNRFGRPGVVIALHRLTRSTRRVFDDLTAARAAASRKDATPIALAEARAVTCNIEMLDPEALTPMPQRPPRPGDAPYSLEKPPIADVPAAPDVALKAPRTATRSIAIVELRPPASRPPPSVDIPTDAAPSSPVVAQPDPPSDAVVEQPDATAEPTTRMATPPFGELIPREPDAPIVAIAAAPESGRIDVPPLPPPPLASTPAAPPPISAAIPAAVVPSPPPHALASTRWTPRRIWAVAVLAGSLLLAVGIVIGATFVAGGTRAASRSSQGVSTVAPTPTAPAPTPTAPAPTPTTPMPTPTEIASPPPAPAHVAAATPPAHDVAKAPSHPKTPSKKPAHAKRHKHAGSSGACTSLTCL